MTNSGLQKARSVIKENDPAFVVGNGINRYGIGARTNDSAPAWDTILLDLWKKYVDNEAKQIPQGISLPEYYDLLVLRSGKKGEVLKKEFCDLMEHWKPSRHHNKFMNYAIDKELPVLTTNFDNTLAQGLSWKIMRGKSSFTRHYPWNGYYYSKKKILDNPAKGFGLWYINGMAKYVSSIRLGLTDYMGAVERARKMIHAGDEAEAFCGKDVSKWVGFNTWLHIIFNRPLFIFGLGLSTDEVFLRWLLIERANYFKKYPARKKKSWYITKSNGGGKDETGRNNFLRWVGIDIITVDSYSDIYEKLFNLEGGE